MACKRCAVPNCTSSTFTTPEKLLISIPSNESLRKKWLDVAQITDQKLISGYFCEDHFDTGKDFGNYMQFKMGFSKKMVITGLPSKFECQKNSKKRPNILSKAPSKKQKSTPKLELSHCEIEDKKLNVSNVDTEVKNNTAKPSSSGIKSKKVLLQVPKTVTASTSTSTESKSIQTTPVFNPNMRSIGIQTLPEDLDREIGITYKHISTETDDILVTDIKTEQLDIIDEPVFINPEHLNELIKTENVHKIKTEGNDVDPETIIKKEHLDPDVEVKTMNVSIKTEKPDSDDASEEYENIPNMMKCEVKSELLTESCDLPPFKTEPVDGEES